MRKKDKAAAWLVESFPDICCASLSPRALASAATLRSGADHTSNLCSGGLGGAKVRQSGPAGRARGFRFFSQCHSRKQSEKKSFLLLLSPSLLLTPTPPSAPRSPSTPGACRRSRRRTRARGTAFRRSERRWKSSTAAATDLMRRRWRP